MPATVQFHELYGAGPTGVDKTGGDVRFKNAGNNVEGTAANLDNPMVIPGAGLVDHSFEKPLRLHIAAGGAFTQISNLRAYSDGTNAWTGVDLYYRARGTYAQPVEPSAANDPPQHEATPMTSFFTATSGAPIDLDATNAGPFDSTGLPKYIGDFLYLVMTVRETATSQLLTGEPISFSFDEIG